MVKETRRTAKKETTEERVCTHTDFVEWFPERNEWIGLKNAEQRIREIVAEISSSREAR